MSAHVLDDLSDYVDGRLAASKRAAVEAHLPSCAECRAEYRHLLSVAQSVRGLGQQPLPAGFMQRLHARRAEEDAAAPRYLLPAPARYVAFALSTLIVGVMIADKMKVMFPITGAASTGYDERLPEPSDVKPAKLMKAEARPERQFAHARGEPIAADASARADRPAAPAPGGPSNEDLQDDLEKQKRKMGIRGYAAKVSPEESAWDRLRTGAEKLNALPPAPLIASNGAPQLLAEKDAADAAKPLPNPEAAGAPLAEAGSAATPAPSPPAEGLVLHSEEERKKAWDERGLRLVPPTVNYANNELLVVVAPDLKSAVEVVGVATKDDGVVVTYRLFPRVEALAGAAKRAGTQVRAYQFRVVPKTDKPVSFVQAE